MSTEVIEEQNTETVEEVEETDLDGYISPAVSIIRSRSIGEHSDSLRVEIRDVDDFATAGDLIALVDAVLARLVDDQDDDPTGFELEFRAVPPEVAKHLKAAMDRLRMTKVKDEGGVEALELELACATEHDEQCPADHAERLKYLRGLIAKARDDQASFQATEPAVTETASPGTGIAHDDENTTCPGGC